jgi:hypothetical protein
LRFGSNAGSFVVPPQDDTRRLQHNAITMFASPWSWLVPLVGAGAVFSAVLLTTPPGFLALAQVVVGPPTGQNPDAAAYALGAAASLALVALVCLAAICFILDTTVRRLR